MNILVKVPCETVPAKMLLKVKVTEIRFSHICPDLLVQRLFQLLKKHYKKLHKKGINEIYLGRKVLEI